MANCANCGAKLEPSYKFCIACGTPVSAEAVTETQPASDDAAPAAPEAPVVEQLVDAPFDTPVGAPVDAPVVDSPFESDDDDIIEPRKKPDAALIFGIAMAVAGAVLIIIVAIAVLTSNN
jgi:hypothetical protein